MKKLYFLCKKLKEKGHIHYYSFFNGNLSVQTEQGGSRRNVAHITDLAKYTKLDREVIEQLAPSRVQPDAWLPIVTNINTLKRGWQKLPQYTYIGRPGFWGNPNKLSVFNNRLDCIVEYEKYARSSPDILARLTELSSKYIVCHCHPLECHGDVLVKLFREFVLTTS